MYFKTQCNLTFLYSYLSSSVGYFLPPHPLDLPDGLHLRGVVADNPARRAAARRPPQQGVAEHLGCISHINARRLLGRESLEGWR